MKKTVIITARVSRTTAVEGYTTEEIEEKAEDILANKPPETLERYDGDDEC